MIKAVISTFVVTSVAFALISNIFLNSILGVFNLSAIPFGELADLHASKKMLQKMEGRHKKMQERHKVKKKRAATRFTKKATRKITSSAAVSAIPVPGVATSAVIVTVAGFEVMDYCEYQQELHEDEVILFETDPPSFDFNQCLENGQKDMGLIADNIKQNSMDVVDEYVDKAGAYKDRALDGFFSWAENTSEDLSDSIFKAIYSVHQGFK